MSTRVRHLDDADLAALVEERDFLLTSLADLEAEHDAGDLDDADYEALKDDYTARAARVIRSIEAREVRSAPAAGRDWRRTAAWVAGGAAVVVIVGFLLAQAVGDRGGGLASGDITQTARSLVLDAGAAAGSGDHREALDLYDEALDLQPSNVEALTYQAWTSIIGDEPIVAGDPDDPEALREAARDQLDEAIALDPGYPDARVFATSLALAAGEPDEAAEHLLAFDGADPPAPMLQLVGSRRLREQVSSELVSTDPVAALEVIDAGLENEPESAPLIAHRGWLIVNSVRPDDTELVELGMSFLDQAVELDPAEPTARVYRAIARAGLLGDPDGAADDLAVYDDLEVPDALAGELDAWLALAFGAPDE